MECRCGCGGTRLRVSGHILPAVEQGHAVAGAEQRLRNPGLKRQRIMWVVMMQRGG